jgi:hypothetical protein
VTSEGERPHEVILMTASQPTGHLTGSPRAIINDASAGNTP